MDDVNIPMLIMNNIAPSYYFTQHIVHVTLTI